MYRFISLSLFVVLLAACTPKASTASLAESDTAETAMQNAGVRLISQIRALPGIKVLDRGAHSSFKTSKSTGINNSPSITPTFVLNGKVCTNGFVEVYNHVVAAKGFSSVKRLSESYEIAPYGLVGSEVVIAVETAK